jgi:hypothetical protein
MALTTAPLCVLCRTRPHIHSHEHTQNFWMLLTESRPDGGDADADAAPGAAASVGDVKGAAPDAPAAAPRSPPRATDEKAGGSAGGKSAAAAAPSAASGAVSDGADALRSALLPRGPAAVHALSRFCRSLDSARTGHVTAGDLKTAL